LSLPINIFLPKIETSEDSETNIFINELTTELEDVYEEVAEHVNGDIRNYADSDGFKWEPTLNGSTPGTFTYTQQIGWSIRQGIFTHIFFDITWSATTAAGNLYLNLPYKVIQSAGQPFVSCIQSSSIAFGAGNSGLTINAIPDTYRGEIWTFGSGTPAANLAAPATGQISGHMFYIGLEYE